MIILNSVEGKKESYRYIVLPYSHFYFTLLFQKAKNDVESGHEQLQQQTRRNSSSDTTTTTHIAQSWKFFDPLASPTGEDHEELLRLEAMLDAKARKANQGLILETRPDIIASHSKLKLKKKNPFLPKKHF